MDANLQCELPQQKSHISVTRWTTTELRIDDISFYEFTVRSKYDFPNSHQPRSLKLEFLTVADASYFRIQLEIEQKSVEATFSEMQWKSADVPVVVDTDSGGLDDYINEPFSSRTNDFAL
jgi:hypothetical protein